MNALSLDAEALERRVKVERRTVRLGETEVDLIEVARRWPKNAQAEKRMFQSLFGKKLTLATAFVDNQALFAIGADYAERLAAMIGRRAACPRPRSATSRRSPRRCSTSRRRACRLSYLETARMARFAAGLVTQQDSIGPDEQQAVARLMTTAGRGAIVSTTNADGRRFEVTTHVPHSAIAGVASLNGALWRIALSPLVNPPMMPPLPVPPPHVTPAVNRPTDGTLYSYRRAIASAVPRPRPRSHYDALARPPPRKALAAFALVEVDWRGSGADLRRGRAVQRAPGAQPLGEQVRVAAWNIQRGRRFDELLRALREEPTLAAADVLLLSEVDCGMARSGNRHVARALAARSGSPTRSACPISCSRTIGARASTAWQPAGAGRGRRCCRGRRSRRSRTSTCPRCATSFPRRRSGWARSGRWCAGSPARLGR